MRGSRGTYDTGLALVAFGRLWSPVALGGMDVTFYVAGVALGDMDI